MKRKLAKVMSMVLAVGLMMTTGCAGGAGAKDTASVSSEKPKSNLKVAMLLPGTINDQGWNAAAYNGLMLVKDKLGLEVAYSEKVAASDYEEVFRGYANQGYGLIIGHGFEFGEAAGKVAKEFPKVMFCITSSDIVQEPNVCSLENLNDQQGFLAGVVAAKVTKSGIVGSVGGMEIPSITAYNRGFEQGVAYVDPSYTALTTCTGDFDDAAKAKETAAAMIAKGADVVTHDADQAGLGVFEAAKEANVLAIGAVGDQYELAPDLMVTSATNEMSKAILLATQYQLDGTLKAQNYQFGVKEGVIGLAPYRNFEDKISDEDKAFIEDVKAKLSSGEIVVKGE